jgi:hypothetical protein
MLLRSQDVNSVGGCKIHYMEVELFDLLDSRNFLMH